MSTVQEQALELHGIADTILPPDGIVGAMNTIETVRTRVLSILGETERSQAIIALINLTHESLSNALQISNQVQSSIHDAGYHLTS